MTDLVKFKLKQYFEDLNRLNPAIVQMIRDRLAQGETADTIRDALMTGSDFEALRTSVHSTALYLSQYGEE